jgi:hypothetical protein
MISDRAFVHGMDLLTKRFEKRLDRDIAKLWQTYLNAQLTEEQFMYAIELSVLESRFFPTAKQLVEFALGSDEQRAAQDWEICLKAASQNKRSSELNLPEAALYALEAVGGLNGLGYCNEEAQPWKKKEFIAAWKSWIPALRKSLPAAASAAVVISPHPFTNNGHAISRL